MKVPREANEEKEVEVGNTIVVGVKMDHQQSKELLTWTLIKAAQPGDQVIALHILPPSSKPLQDPDGKSPFLPIGNSLGSMLDTCEGFCNLKQIDLKMKVCKGSSVRRVLVKEVASFGASQLILGAAIGPSTISVAKYCAKKLSRKCSVVAVSNGRIVFPREAIENNKKNASNCITESECGSTEINDDMLSLDASPEQNCPICDTPYTPQETDESIEQVESLLTSSDSPKVQRSPEIRASWSFRCWPVLTKEKLKVSIVPRAMQLHTDSRHRKSNPTSRLNGDKDPSRSFATIHEEDSRLTRELESLQKKYSSISRSFSYQELVDATSNFSCDKLIGKGGSSRVYKGCYADGKQLAVKILKPSEDALRECVAEIEILTTLNHKNIVSLCGFCFEKDHLILVYEYLSKGSLEENLHGDKEDKCVIRWAERYQVALGIAQALDYLHDGSRIQPVIHKDVKSSNILLLDDFEPQLSDFGLATRASASQSLSAFSDVAGTFGYLAPEYFMYGRVNEKIDVYAFGVVLLELLSGRKPISTGGSQGKKSLVMWAKPILQGGKLKKLVDPCLSDKYDNDQMERMILAASLCISRAARSRPRMAQVLKLLQGDGETVKWAKSKVSALEEIDELEDEFAAYSDSNIRSHINLALLDVDDDSTSVSSSMDQSLDFMTSNSSLDDYLQGMWSQ